MDGGRDQPLRLESNDRHQIVIKRNRLKSDCFQISLWDALDPSYHFVNIGGVSYHKNSFPHADKLMFIVGRLLFFDKCYKMNDCDFNQREREGFCSINVLSDSVIQLLNERYQSEFAQTTTVLIKIIQKTSIDALTAAMNVFTDGAVNNMNVDATIEWNTFYRASTATAGTSEWLWAISDRSATHGTLGRERLSPQGGGRACASQRARPSLRPPAAAQVRWGRSRRRRRGPRRATPAAAGVAGLRQRRAAGPAGPPPAASGPPPAASGAPAAVVAGTSQRRSALPADTTVARHVLQVGDQFIRQQQQQQV
uniref:Uncharacterized protein n=1 Tax=Plectus sambesii TaxID=2011161 RepID=A0A914UWC0_9BILA